ncbi:GDP-perosamine synthase [subsurface metagenome]
MNVPFHWVTYGKEEVEAVLKEIKDNWFSPRGPKIPELGQRFADIMGKKYGWPVSSGTGSIHLALLAAGVGEGDLVAVPSYTCSPGVYPVSYVGAIPVFVDCELETYGLDPEHLDQVLTEHGGKIVAAIPVDLYGAACKTEVLDVCRKHGVIVIEDVCESVGALYHDSEDRAGKWADFACYSMRGDKIVTALGTGGVVLTDDAEMFRVIKLWSDLGLKVDTTMGRYRDLEMIGFNYEIGNVACAFGIAQMDRLQEIVDGRRNSARMWREALADSEGIVQMAEYDGHVWYQYPLLFERLENVDQLDAMGERIVARGTPLIPPFWPMEKQPPYSGIEADCPQSTYASEHVFLFPCYPALTEEQVEYMAGVIMEEYAKVG